MKYLWMRLFLDDGANDSSGTTPPAGKTFTQEEVNRMMAEEKRQGRASVLKDLGVENEDSIKEILKRVKDQEDANSSELDKAKKALETEKLEKEKTAAKAQALEQKLEAVSAGVLPEFLEDALAIARVKVTDKEDLATVLKGMKEKYGMFFSTHGTGGSSGTGNLPGGKKTEPANTDGIGTRLGKAQADSVPKKSHYFG